LSKYFILLSHNQQKYITQFSQFPFTLSKDAKCRKEQEERELIEVRNLVKDYGGHLAVDHLSFTINDGQIYGFLGPNGAGKSTTMNIMTGYIGATEGDVLINGHNIL